ncbi:MAG: UDP-N-acetylmuramoyl-L-alanine--D-glutamate ligase [Eggerthellaceae bacterium]|jgi:UDP-N-acetylmuramoylalanine--D-glutamate ligase
MADEVKLMADRKHAPEHLGRVLVLGLGKSGRAAARYCAGLLGTRVDSLSIAAGAENEAAHAFIDEIARDGVSVAYGDDGAKQLAAGADVPFDCCIASPGIPFWAPLYVDGKAASRELMSEVEFAWRESAADSTWVAITGTNGKTTTTACCAALLRQAGMNARAVGNIGDTCLDAVAAADTDVYVAEVSSYQLASTIDFAPNVAVLLNITPDHVHWHRTLEAYRDAKFKILANLPKTPGAVAVLDATNDVVRERVRALKALSPEERGFAYIPLGTKAGIEGDMRAACGADNAAFLDVDGKLHIAFDGRDHVLCAAADLQIKGAHNVSNALAASAAAVALGAPDAAIVEALRAFKPLEHRIEPCGTVAGVRCYNDSKATNVDATLKALAAFPETRPVVLLGGDDKGTDLSALVAAAHRHVRAVVCFGAAGERFERAFADAADAAPADFKVVRAGGMESALDAALGMAQAGEVVLLSPACASFDEFSCFEERGDVFKRLVAERARTLGA